MVKETEIKNMRAINAYKQKLKRQFRKKHGLCTRCGAEKPQNGKATCATCLLKIKLTRKRDINKDKPLKKDTKKNKPRIRYCDLTEEQKKIRREYTLKRYYTLKAAGICVKCAKKEALPGLTLCAECRIDVNQRVSGFYEHSLKWIKKEREAGRIK